MKQLDAEPREGRLGFGLRTRAVRIAGVVGASTALVLLCVSCSPGSGSSEDLLEEGARLGAAFETALADTGVPGGAVALMHPDGEVTVEVFGEAAEGRAVEPDTAFMYRSITKSFVGTVILQLADEGELSLDDPISAYVTGVPGGDAVTLRQLGAMRSGIANYSAHPALGELLSADPAREPSIDELLALAYPESSQFEPDAAYEYSNTNTLLLGEVIESVTGREWFDEVQLRVTAPLGLAQVGYGTDPDSDAAMGFQLYEDGDGITVEELPWVAPGWFGAAGALAGTVEDLAVWGDALGSGSLLDPATQEARLDMLGSTSDDPASPEYDRYGFAIGEIDGWIGHTGNGLGYQSLTMHEPDSGRTIAILLNATGEDGDLPAHVFQKLLAEAL